MVALIALWPAAPGWAWVLVDSLALSILILPGMQILIVRPLAEEVDSHKRMVEALRESERMLNEAQVVGGLGSYVVDVASGKWISSDVLVRIYGIDAPFERNLGGWLSIVHPDERAFMEDYLSNEVIGRRQRFDREYRIVRRSDGEERWVHGLGEMDVNTERQPVRMIGTVQDITERKQAEEVLRLTRFSVERASDALSRLQPVVDETLRLLRPSIPDGVDIDLHMDGAVPSILADASQVHQVVMNLVTNAIHALEGQRGSVRIALSICDVSVGVTPADLDLSEGRYARLAVSDTGKGMDASTMERIFEPFLTTRGVGQGTGLGLSVVHGIMQAYAGAITVESQPGHGAVFHAYFPASTPHHECVEEREQRSRSTAIEGAGQHILYVDDEESLVSVAKRSLERLGYRVTGLTSSAKAISLIRSEGEDLHLAITDLAMLGALGIEIADDVQLARGGLPVVLVSGRLSAEVRKDAAAVGIREVRSKPYDAKTLAGIVDRLLRESPVS